MENFWTWDNFKQQILSWESIEIGIVLINKPKQKMKQTASLRHKDTRCAKIVSRTSLQSWDLILVSSLRLFRFRRRSEQPSGSGKENVILFLLRFVWWITLRKGNVFLACMNFSFCLTAKLKPSVSIHVKSNHIFVCSHRRHFKPHHQLFWRNNTISIFVNRSKSSILKRNESG